MGGRGASSSEKNIKSRFRNPRIGIQNTEKKDKNHFSNKKDIVDFIKQQTNIDISKYEEEREKRSRAYYGIHLEDMPKNDRTTVLTLLNEYNVRTEYNGGLGYALYYKKK